MNDIVKAEDQARFKAPRLPYHDAIEERYGVDRSAWKSLTEAIYPGAKTVDAVVMALSYCKARNLDPFKRPVHIVGVWDSSAGQMVETVWPGISELRTTAFRTGQYAGCDETEFGPMVTKTFKGMVGKRNSQTEKTVEVTYPEWARMTVYRTLNGALCRFVGPKVLWLESYASIGQSDVPNEMWETRPQGQLDKCFDVETEVLTTNGFEKFNAVTGQIMQVTESGIEPTDSVPFKQSYNGPMVCASGNALNFSVTPNHDMITSLGKIEAGILYELAKSNADYRIPYVIENESLGWGGDLSVLQAAAAILCDGSKRGNRWSVSVSRVRKVERLDELDLHDTRYIRRCSGEQAIMNGRVITTKHDKTVFGYDASLIPVTSDKLLDRDVLLSLNSEEAAVLVDAMIFFDGNVTANGTRRFYSSNKKLMAQFELAVVLSGQAVSSRSVRSSEGNKPNFCVSVSRKRSAPALSISGSLSTSKAVNVAMKMEPQNASGEVWCCRVPSGVIVVRRRGLSMVCGNCAEAAALRKAFPEELGNDMTAEEMEGRRFAPIYQSAEPLNASLTDESAGSAKAEFDKLKAERKAKKLAAPEAEAKTESDPVTQVTEPEPAAVEDPAPEPEAEIIDAEVSDVEQVATGELAVTEPAETQADDVAGFEEVQEPETAKDEADAIDELPMIPNNGQIGQFWERFAMAATYNDAKTIVNDLHRSTDFKALDQTGMTLLRALIWRHIMLRSDYIDSLHLECPVAFNLWRHWVETENASLLAAEFIEVDFAKLKLSQRWKAMESNVVEHFTGLITGAIERLRK